MSIKSWRRALRKASVGLALLLPLALSWVSFQISEAWAQPKKEGKHLIVQITSEKQLAVLKKTLQNLDPKTYRFTVTSTLGALPLDKAVLVSRQVTPIDPGGQSSVVHSTLTDFVSRVNEEQLREQLKAADKTARFQVKDVDKGGKHLIVEITSEKQLAVLKKTLQNLDPKTHRFTVTSTLGALPMDKAVLVSRQVTPIDPGGQSGGFESVWVSLTNDAPHGKLEVQRLQEQLKAADTAARFQATEVEIK